MNEQKTLIGWDDQPITIPEKNAIDKKSNPCIALYGPGPEGAKCKDCSLLGAIKHDATWYKCKLRNNTHGRASDHKVRWPACGKFQQKGAKT